jgi:riboflavin synthase
MFTGIVQAVGRVRALEARAGGARIVIDAGMLDLSDVRIGDSIAVDGVCLTVVALDGAALSFDISAETVDCTSAFRREAHVNLEKALRLADRLGGHLVSGHVDGIGTVLEFEARGDNRWLAVRTPLDLGRYIARKGAIAINGVSLTVNAVHETVFEVNLIPHTLDATNLHALSVGAQVNLEVDMLARYIERLSSARQ